MVITLGFHLFPFRTEKLSPIVPMVLRKSGRVGSRHFRVSGCDYASDHTHFVFDSLQACRGCKWATISGAGSAAGIACTRLLFLHCRFPEGDVPSLRQGMELGVVYEVPQAS